MKRRNVSALACGLVVSLMAVTVAYAGLSADAASEKQEAAYETMAAGNIQKAANLTAEKEAGIAEIVNNGKTVTVNESIKNDLKAQAAKTAAGVPAEEADQKSAETETAAAADRKEKEEAWEGRAIASNVQEYVYVRAEASEDSAPVGKLVRGAAGDVLEQGEEWTMISSGEVEG